MFSLLKQQLSIVDVINKYIKYELKEIGDNTFTPEDDTCVFCGHKDCLRIKEDGEDSIYKCFSCESKGDFITFVASLKNVSPKDAALLIAKDFSVELPKGYSPIQELFDLAAEYYHKCFLETIKKIDVLGNRSPAEYQLLVRKHSLETLKAIQLGWSDGGLIVYLTSLGFDQDSLKESGLVSKRGTDYLPAKTFIYPHFVGNKVSHFTFKDPTGRVLFQLGNKFKLNSHEFYGEESLTMEGRPAIVEGENDRISLIEANWPGPVLATIGNMSKPQIEWLSTNLHGKDVVTFFDNDEAGAKYRTRLDKLSLYFRSLTQVTPPGEKQDIDEYLKAGGNLETLVESARQVVSEVVVRSEDEPTQNKIFEQEGSYWKVKYREGNAYPFKVSNFLIILKNVYICNHERIREIVVIREDGKRSRPIIINSETKVSLKLFRTFVANAVDASWYGTEEDLIYVWETVYSKKEEKCVYIPSHIGHLPEHHGWIFRDSFITSTGATIVPDSEGIMWVAGSDSGLKPGSLHQDASIRGKLDDVPRLNSEFSKEERWEMLKGFSQNLSNNLGNTGQALLMLGWCYANVFSDDIFDKYRCFPFLFLWGRHGKGKTNIIKWLLSLFGTDEIGYTTIPQLKSGVGFSRKIGWMASLPVAVDEVRVDQETLAFYGTFRSWYNRVGRVIAAEKSTNIRTTEVRTNFIFGGQDVFTDLATRTRCVPIQISTQGRELEISYRWIESRLQDLSCIGYDWIERSHLVNKKSLFSEVDALHRKLIEEGCESRTSINWAIVGTFAEILREKLFPEFDFQKYLISEALVDTTEQGTESIAIQFLNVVERLQVGREKAKITRDHIIVDKEGMLHIWLNGVVQIVLAERQETREGFSKTAIRAALREESYYKGEARTVMGIEEANRRVMVFRTLGEDIPEVVQNIAHMAKAG